MPAIGTGQAWGEEGLSFTDPNETIHRAAIDRIKSNAPAAASFKAVIIIGLIRGIVKPGVEEGQSMSRLIAALRECSEAARAYGVKLALEPINRYETTLINNTAQGLDLIERVSADNFGLLPDTFHMNVEEPVIENSLQACNQQIFHFHVAASNRWYPGAGHLDFKSILGTLAATGYLGYISGEFLPKPDAETAARQSIAYLRKLLDERPKPGSLDPPRHFPSECI